ncbi:MAG: two-component regulator propeller domain-containing protein [Candidatus Latescibacterota bacterium]|nr:two-component regulator propeller domain-containing protein [Candidatus Latescibacterota bacterium]
MLLFSIVALMFLALPTQAQLKGAEWQAYTSMRNINKLLVHQDAVWAITSGGVLRYDQQQQSYNRFTRLDGLPGNRISSLAVDANGHLWFGTLFQGLSRYRPEEDRFDPPFFDFLNLGINALEPYQDRIFVGSERGVSAFLTDKEEVKETYRQLGHLAKDTEVKHLVVFAGHLWVGTVGGLAWADLDQPNLQDPNSWRSSTLVSRVRDLLVHQDTLFVASSRSVWHMLPDFSRPEQDFSDANIVSLGLLEGQLTCASRDGRFFRRERALSWRRISAQGIGDAADLSDAAGPMWVASSSGLRVMGADSPPPPREPKGNFFFDITKTADDHIWVASVPKDNLPAYGLYQFDGEGWTTHTLKTNLASETVTAVETDANGLLWVGNWGRGIDVRDTTGTWRRLNAANSALEGIGGGNFVAVSDIDRDDEGLMWVGSVLVGLVVMDAWKPSQALLYDQETIKAVRDINKIDIGPDRLKWIATPRDGFILFDDGGTPFAKGDESGVVFNTLTHPDLTSDRASDILADRSGRVWVATDGGLNAVRGTYSREDEHFAVENWTVYNAINGLPTSVATALAEDNRGNIWVGTEDGLARIGTTGLVEFVLNTTNSGLVDNRINSLYFDADNGELWIGTLDGLSRLQIGGKQGADALEAQTYPNPFLVGTRGAQLTLVDLPLGATVQIFTAVGQPVRRIEGTPGQGTASWDGQNDSGFLVGSGIYYFVARDEAGNAVKGKFAVINGR